MELLVTRMVRDSGHLHTTTNILVVRVDEAIVIYQLIYPIKRVLFLYVSINQRVKREWQASPESRRRRQDTLLLVP